MSRSSFRPNPRAFAQMGRGPEIQAACLSVAGKAQTIAEGLAAEHVYSGEYLASFNVRATEVEWGGHLRAAGILENLSPHAAAVEWANAQDPTAYRVLGRTAAALRDG